MQYFIFSAFVVKQIPLLVFLVILNLILCNFSGRIQRFTQIVSSFLFEIKGARMLPSGSVLRAEGQPAFAFDQRLRDLQGNEQSDCVCTTASTYIQLGTTFATGLPSFYIGSCRHMQFTFTHANLLTVFHKTADTNVPQSQSKDGNKADEVLWRFVFRYFCLINWEDSG
jgi:hypothetical protein